MQQSHPVVDTPSPRSGQEVRTESRSSSNAFAAASGSCKPAFASIFASSLPLTFMLFLDGLSFVVFFGCLLLGFPSLALLGRKRYSV